MKCSNCGCLSKYHAKHPSSGRRPCNAFRVRELEPGEKDIPGLHTDEEGTWRPCNCKNYKKG